MLKRKLKELKELYNTWKLTKRTRKIAKLIEDEGKIPTESTRNIQADIELQTSFCPYVGKTPKLTCEVVDNKVISITLVEEDVLGHTEITMRSNEQTAKIFEAHLKAQLEPPPPPRPKVVYDC